MKIFPAGCRGSSTEDAVDTLLTWSSQQRFVLDAGERDAKEQYPLLT
jgi:hypothetical protein